MENLFEIGDIVEVKKCEFECLGFVYETYRFKDHRGISIVTDTLKFWNLGGFNVDEQREYLSLLKRTGINFEYTDQQQLNSDYYAYILPMLEKYKNSNEYLFDE